MNIKQEFLNIWESIWKYIRNNKSIFATVTIVLSLFFTSLGIYVHNENNYDFTLAVWPEYITNQQYSNFKSETDIDIKEVYFESNENLLSKLNTTSFDMILPTDYIITALVDNNYIKELDTKNIDNYWSDYYKAQQGKIINDVNSNEIMSSNFENNFNSIWNAVSSVYPVSNGFLNDYAVPYQMSDIKIVYNLTDPVVQKMFNEAPELIGSYQSFEWISNNGGKILSNRNMRDFLSIGQKATGHSVNDYSDESMNDTYNYLSNIMPNTSLQHDDLARSVAHLDSWSIGYSFPGDFVMGIEDEWLEQNKDIPWYEAMLFTKPKEGSVVYFDVMTQGYSSNVNNYTSEFISFLSRPEIQSGAPYQNAEEADISKTSPDTSLVSEDDYKDYYNDLDNKYSTYYGGLDFIYYAPANKYVYEGYSNDVELNNSYASFCNLNGQSSSHDNSSSFLNSVSELDKVSSGMTNNSNNYQNNWEDDYLPSNNNCYDEDWNSNVSSTYGLNGLGFSDEVVSKWFSSSNYVNLYYQALIINTDFNNDYDGNGIYDVQEISTRSDLMNIYKKTESLPNGKVVTTEPKNSYDFLFNRPYGDEMYRYSDESMSVMSRLYNELLALQNII
ncbi:MAG: hypothetical protein HRS57_01475 [Mycoplasmataceae bacterium]|nr:hypothetical protein [Mycoplasmataceae bacterium]